MAPLDVTASLRPERAELLALLRDLSADEWARPTECPAWTVKGIALHILGDDLSLLTRQRDASTDSLTLFAEDHPRVGVATFTIDGLDSSLVSAALSAEYGIGVRDGKFCAHLLVDALLDDATAGTAIRASVGLANTVEHVDRLLRAVATLAATGPAFDYALTADGWVPAQDPRDLSLPRPW